MKHRSETLTFYLLAASAPLLVTLIGLLIEDHIHYANILLFYLLAVLIVAARTSIKPALLCALASFLVYNFLFTEPRYSLLMIHREDILTAVFFLIMAALTGRQAARLRLQLSTLQSRSHFARIQLELLEQLAAAINKQQVFSALNDAFAKLHFTAYFVFDAAVDDVSAVKGSVKLKRDEIETIRAFLNGQTVNTSDKFRYYALNDGVDNVAAAGIAQDYENTMAEELTQEIFETLVYQASLALARTRLVEDFELEKVDKERELLRSALLTSVSHDLRTPLSSMIGSTSSLLELNESLSAEQKRELLEAVLQEASRLDNYIQKLLDMTRLGYGELQLERDWIGLDDILSVVIRRIKPLLDRHEIRTSMAPAMPLLYVHAALIEQAIYNVLENAVKYSPPASVIELKVSYDADYAVIDIIDQGPGIPADEREQIFDMFYTVKRGDAHSAGTGLGLAICKGMLAAHGGTVTIIDRPETNGSIFRLNIRLHEQTDKDDDKT